MNAPINPTEIAISMMVFQRLLKELSKDFPAIDDIKGRRLTYLLIETYRAAHRVSGKKCTLISVLNTFDVTYDTYYTWRLAWHSSLPAEIKNESYSKNSKN